MIRSVYFDAVGTLIEPAPSAAAVYLDVGRDHGSRLTLDEIARRFRAAFAAEDDVDRRAGWRTDEERERRRWQHFAQPPAWHCLAGAGEVLAELSRRGYRIGLASNFDARLRGVAAGLAELAPVRSLVISSEVGWRKPSAKFFERVISAAGGNPEEVLFVGDDPVNDGEGANAAGLKVCLLDTPAALGELLTRLP